LSRFARLGYFARDGKDSPLYSDGSGGHSPRSEGQMINDTREVSNVVEELEKRLLPALQKAADEISRQFPRVKATTWSSPVGSLTDYQGHDLGIDCLFMDATPDQTDNVALS